VTARTTGGVWLLDPTNITISSAASTGGSLAAAQGQAGATTISTTDIQSAINAGTSVNIVGSGWIQVNSALTFTNNSGTEATLTLSNTIAARQYIHVKANITATAGNTPVNVVIRSAGGQILIGSVVYPVYPATSTAGLINVSVMASTPQNPFFGECIERLRSKESVTKYRAWEETGPMHITEVYHQTEYPLTVYPSHYFTRDHFSGYRYKGNGHCFATQFWGSTNGYERAEKWKA
jgi:hypothetical protein